MMQICVIKKLNILVGFLSTASLFQCLLQLAQSESQSVLLVIISGRATCINTVNYFPKRLETETVAKIRVCYMSYKRTDVAALL